MCENIPSNVEYRLDVLPATNSSEVQIMQESEKKNYSPLFMAFEVTVLTARLRRVLSFGASRPDERSLLKTH